MTEHSGAQAWEGHTVCKPLVNGALDCQWHYYHWALVLNGIFGAFVIVLILIGIWCAWSDSRGS